MYISPPPNVLKNKITHLLTVMNGIPGSDWSVPCAVGWDETLRWTSD